MDKPDKITESLKIHLPDQLKHDIQDQAMVEDRSVSDWVRRACEVHLYGIVGCRNNFRNGAKWGEGGRRGAVMTNPNSHQIASQEMSKWKAFFADYTGNAKAHQQHSERWGKLLEERRWADAWDSLPWSDRMIVRRMTGQPGESGLNLLWESLSGNEKDVIRSGIKKWSDWLRHFEGLVS